MKGRSYFGYKVLFFMAMVATIAHVAARGPKGPFDFYNPDPQPDTPANNKGDTARKLRFPIHDKTGEPTVDNTAGSGMDLKDPSNIKQTVEYDPDSQRYYFNRKLGDRFLSNPTYMTMDEYMKYQGQQDEKAYWKRRLDALTLFNRKPQLPEMYKEGLFDRIFGNDKIQVKPQGNVDVTFGGNWQNIKNPALVQRAQKYGIFDFDMQMNINLLATVGDKLKLNIAQNTKATFDYQNMQKLEYTGKEDEILKKIEAGNVSFPLKSNLISGVQSLFGLKTQLQFGKLWVTAVLSQQKSQRKSTTVQGGAQTQILEIKADNYEENRNFLLGQYFRGNYNNALKEFPIINSLVTINKIQVWVTNRTGVVAGVRDILTFMDLGEASPYQQTLADPTSPIPNGLPDNNSNRLYRQLTQNPNGRQQSAATRTATSLGLLQGQDFERTTARQLTASEFSYNPQLGYILLNTQMNPDDVLGVAYRYTYNGRVYQVGEFAEDLPPDSTNQKVMFLKLLKGTSARPTLPVWNLMMKNIYALGGLGVSKENFILNIMYQDPGGGEKRYLPDGPNAGRPLLSILNLDRLNAQNQPAPDGVFDFVEGITINTQQGKVIFPVLEPFGEDLAPALGNDPQLQKKYLYSVLYDSTKTIALQFQQNNRYILRGSYKSSSSSDIFLGGFNIPPGSVSVTAGGQKLIENQDYQIDYGMGRVKILNTGILSSGVPINVQYEDNSTFGFQQQNFMGARFDYYVNPRLAIGGTFMRLTERPFTQKVNFGDDPIRNTVLGLDASYQSEFPAVTRALDKLPIYSTSSPSIVSASGEVATLLPGHSKQINALDPEGSVYMDDFEGTTSTYDIKMPVQNWFLASTPYGATNKSGVTLFPEAADNDQLTYGMNRARLAWYFIEPTLVDGSGGLPKYVKEEPLQHYIRIVQQKDVFPQTTQTALQTSQSTLDLGFYPNQRGPYNFDVTNINPDGTLTNPASRWGGIMRSIDNTDFEASNVEYIQFWLLDPFINNNGPTAGGSLYFNLGNVSEDVLKDSRMFFENGISYPFNTAQLDTTVWGNVPKFEQQVTRSFDNDPAARSVQDVGYDGMTDDGERSKFNNFLNGLSQKVGGNSPAYVFAQNDPSNDNYLYYRDQSYEDREAGILERYKRFNNPHGDAPITDPNAKYSSAATTLPQSEDINRDNTLNEAESYYQYRVDLAPGAMEVGQNFIINKQTSNVKLPNGNNEMETWYQFKIPIRDFSSRVGGISDFRSIRFMRMFLSGFQDSVIMRFATLELGRNQWRTYKYSLLAPGENVPQQNQATTDMAVTSVSVEENSTRSPIPYKIPPGVQRQLASIANGQNVQLNEKALSVRVCQLSDGDARAVFKEATIDMRQFTYLRMFLHAESMIGQPIVNNGDLRAFIRIGSDFTNNYYEYQVPLKITLPGTDNENDIWPAENNIDLVLQDLVNAKLERDNRNASVLVPYQTVDSKGNTIVIVGSPNIGNVRNIMLGVANPKKNDKTPGDDGLPKCIEVWYNEMRMAGTNDRAGYAAAGKLSLQMADLGNVNFSGSMHTQGYGNIDQKINQRFQDDFYQYNGSTNMALGKFFPVNWGVQLPMFFGYTQNVSTPKYDPYDQDVILNDALDAASSAARRDSLRKASEDFTSITSINFTNVRITGNKQKTKTYPWSLKNFDFTYSYNEQFKRNPLILADNLTTQRYGLGYTYAIKPHSIEPFKKMVHSRSKWFALVKDFNFNPLPSSFTFRSDMNRVMERTQVRNIDDGPYQIPPTYYKNFLWNRNYTLRWELTRSLSFDYTALNTSSIDEPYGEINSKEKRDSLWQKIGTFGRNTYFSQTFNSNYNVPLQKLPVTDWVSLRLGYSANYSWTTAAPLAYALGNTIGNTQTKTVNGDFNFTQLYNKNRFLRAINQKTPPKGVQPSASKFSSVPQSSSTRDNKVSDKQVKDLRSKKKEEEDKRNALRPDNIDTTKKNAPALNDTTKSKKPQADSTQAKKDTLATKPPLEYRDSLKTVNPALTDQQLDSMVKVHKAQEQARIKAEKAKKKKERKAARKLRRAQTPKISPGVRFIGRLLTMLTRTNVIFTENAGTILPGYMDSTRFLGVNNYSGAPGLDFAFGYQPTATWFASQASAGRLSRDSLFNAQLQQQYSQNISIASTLQPFPDFRIELSLTRTFSKSHSDLYKDTGSGSGFQHLTPYETGSFNISYAPVKTMFKTTGANSSVFNEFLENRKTISTRQGNQNPYTNGIVDPNDPNYKKGYTQYSQDVLIPSFIAAYTGRNAQSQALIDYSDKSMRANPFKYFYPMPNWRINYNGLAKLPFFAQRVTSLVLSHAFIGSLSMNGFNSSLLYRDLYGLGFPSFIDSNSGNYIPFFQVPNVTIAQAFSPLIGFDVAMRNNITAKFEVRRSKMASLSLIDYQVSENSSTEYVIGGGYRIKGLQLPFSILGVRKLVNEVIVKLDIGLRDDRSSNNYLANNISIVSSGQKVLRISPSIDYMVNKSLTLHAFYNRQQTIPYVSNSYPITNTQAGITLRFIFAQ